MAVHLTEEEQMAQLRRWWSDNGKSTLIMVVLIVGGYLGWEAWRANQLANAESAGAVYQNLAQAVQIDETSEDESQSATIEHLATELKQAYPDNLYASQAALFVAREAVQKGDLQAAAAELAWVIEKNVDPALTLVAQSRLARLEMAQKNWDAALAQVQEPENEAFVSTFAELRGDILVEKGDATSARAAYQRALDHLVEGQEVRAQLLQIKLDNLQSPEGDNA